MHLFGNQRPTAVRHCPQSKHVPLPSQELATFGFRGEALSSLCAVADVSIVTRTAEQARRPAAGTQGSPAVRG